MAATIGLVMGAVFVIMGIAYRNSGIWILGLICLAMGGVAKTKLGPGRRR